MRYYMVTTEEFNAMRRAQLFNIKVKNIDSSIMGLNKDREKQLELERQKLSTVLSTKANIKNSEEILQKVRK